MNQAQSGVANDQTVHVQEPIPGQVLRDKLAVIHGGKNGDQVHGLRKPGSTPQDSPRKRGYDPIEGMIFVFGSNLAGIHGAGAAATAREKRNFPYHCGEGLAMGCYALPTKDLKIKTLSLNTIRMEINIFLSFATELLNTEAGWAATRTVAIEGHTKFQVTRVGCGLAGLKDEDIAPMFFSAPPNCWFDDAWTPYLPGGTNFWGTV